MKLANNVERDMMYHAGTDVEFDGDDKELRDLIDLDEQIPVLAPGSVTILVDAVDLDFA